MANAINHGLFVFREPVKHIGIHHCLDYFERMSFYYSERYVLLGSPRKDVAKCVLNRVFFELRNLKEQEGNLQEKEIILGK